MMDERDLSLGWLRFEIGHLILGWVVAALGGALALLNDDLAIVGVLGGLFVLATLVRIGWRLAFPPRIKPRVR